MTASVIYSLPSVGSSSSGDPESLRDQIERGLVGTTKASVPGATAEDRKWAYKRSVPTTVLYDEAGLRLYDAITSDAPEYYPFSDELNLISEHGGEIVRAMGFPHIGAATTPVSSEVPPKHHHDFPPAKPWKPARWGDTAVGKWNQGVNGEEGLASGGKRGWDVVELGAGALRKTAHLLSAFAATVPPSSDSNDAPITYHALDLSHPELDRVLGQMDDKYGNELAGRIDCIGLHGDYTAGIQLVRSGGLANITAATSQLMTPMSEPLSGSSLETPDSPDSTLLATPALELADLPEAHLLAVDGELHLETSSSISAKLSPKVAPLQPSLSSVDEDPSATERPLHFLFLGSSLGNFDRADAGPFLHSLPLRQGDTILLGLDGRPAPGPEGKHKVEMAYNDPSGHTRAFEEHGWAVARRELGLTPDDGVEFTGRYNEALGRYESYFRAKHAQTLHLPGRGIDVSLDEGELLNIEWSYKYSVTEALEMFEGADLRVVNSWKAPDSEYRLWLLERPEVRFNQSAPSTTTTMLESPSSSPKAIPSWDEWQAMWKLWDHITLSMIPCEMLHQKPIDLRHICLFYLGHIPTFLDIFLARITDGTHTDPQYFKNIFERGIDPDVDDPTQIHAHSEVPQCEEDWPALDEIVAFRDAVRARVRGMYDEMAAGKTVTRRVARGLFMALEHEAMHAETLLYMLLQSPLTRPPTATPQWDVLAAQWAVGTKSAAVQGYSGVLDVPATNVVLGHDDVEADDPKFPLHPNHEFGWDNEHPRNAVRVPAFRAEALPITNAEYLAFLDCTGALGSLTPSTAPASWVQVDKTWAVRTLYGPVPMSVAAAWPLMASRDELAAFATSRGGRLPTEPELRALWALPNGPRPAGLTANTGFRHWHPVPAMPSYVDHAGATVHGHNGGVWEWTSTPFAPLDEQKFEASELYPGYSADFFDGKHFVVLGGSFATVPHIAQRASFRNWYQGNYRFAWCGARVVYDV